MYLPVIVSIVRIIDNTKKSYNANINIKIDVFGAGMVVVFTTIYVIYAYHH
jgi:hypothetical protein